MIILRKILKVNLLPVSLLLLLIKLTLIFAIIGGAIIAAMFIFVVAEETCDGLREKISNL